MTCMKFSDIIIICQESGIMSLTQSHELDMNTMMGAYVVFTGRNHKHVREADYTGIV